MADTIKESKDLPVISQKKEIPKDTGIAKQRVKETLRARERELADSSTRNLVARIDQTADTSIQGSIQQTRDVSTVVQKVTDPLRVPDQREKQRKVPKTKKVK